ncbi:MAG: hypothetical protein ACK55P_00685, partial [Planctomyces sp.]
AFRRSRGKSLQLLFPSANGVLTARALSLRPCPAPMQVPLSKACDGFTPCHARRQSASDLLRPAADCTH